MLTSIARGTGNTRQDSANRGAEAVFTGVAGAATLIRPTLPSPALPVLPSANKAAKSVPGSSLSEAQAQMVVDHLSTVRYVARQIAERLPQHVELEELVSAGTLGLVDAARKYNAGKNVQFRSYAQFRIRGAILDSLRALDWSPRELRRKARSMEEAARNLQLRLGRAPQDAEIAAAMDLSLLELQQMQAQIKGLEVSALNVERGEDGGEDELAFVPADERENPLLQCLEAEARERLIEAIKALPERERTVMSLYYYEEMTMREIGTILGVVESRVSQIHHLALGRLRGLLADLRDQTVKTERLRVRRAS